MVFMKQIQSYMENEQNTKARNQEIKYCPTIVKTMEYNMILATNFPLSVS